MLREEVSYLSNTQLTAAVPPGNINVAGTASVTVITPAPGGGTSGGYFLLETVLPLMTEQVPPVIPYL